MNNTFERNGAHWSQKEKNNDKVWKFSYYYQLIFRNRRKLRQRIVEGELFSDDSFLIEQNFDEEFEQIKGLHVNIENSVDTHNPTQSNQSPRPEDRSPPEADSELTLDTNYFRKMLTTLHGNSLQIFKRIAVIEDSLLKSGNLVTTKNVEAEKTAAEKYYAFSKSHGLPMKTMDEINKFENNLSHAEFEEEAVSSHIHTFQLVQTIDSKKMQFVTNFISTQFFIHLGNFIN